ncbi:MAG TPA: hypothetical protein VK809_08575, partial [Bacteroidia bacterium]|nr:hypothetical protein [Bacteroidia bacterium]
MKKGYLKYLFFIPALFVLAGCSKPYSEALPTVQVTSVEAYGVADSVLITGTVTSQGGGPIQYEGFSFSNTPTFDLLSRQVVGSSGSATFRAVLPAYHDSTFYFEAFAANEYGYAVSKPYAYTVPAAKPDSAPCTLRSNSFTIGSNTYSLSGISTNPSPSFGSYEVSASFSGGFYNYDVYFNQLPTNGIYSVLT